MWPSLQNLNNLLEKFIKPSKSQKAVANKTPISQYTV
jgi:hypothetical protein